MTTLTDAERELVSRLFGYVPELEPLEQMIAAVERILADRLAQQREEIAAAILASSFFGHEAKAGGAQFRHGMNLAARIARQATP